MPSSASTNPANRAERESEVVPSRTAPSTARRAISEPLSLGRYRPRLRVAGRDLREEVVERADRAAEQATAPPEQVALDPVDIRPVGHDQERLVVEARQIALEQERNLARVGRPREEAQSHRAMVVLDTDGSGRADTRKRRCEREFGLLATASCRAAESTAGAGAAATSTVAAPAHLQVSQPERPTSAAGRGGPQRGPASCRHRDRTDPQPWTRAERRCTSGAKRRPCSHRLPCRSYRKREQSSGPSNRLL